MRHYCSHCRVEVPENMINKGKNLNWSCPLCNRPLFSTCGRKINWKTCDELTIRILREKNYD